MKAMLGEEGTEQFTLHIEFNGRTSRESSPTVGYYVEAK